jgi:hypothetical protein
VRIYIIGFLFLMLVPNAFAGETALPIYPDPKEPLKTGGLLFLRLPEIYDVFLDDEYQGRTPLLLSGLEPGTSILTLKSESKIHTRELEVTDSIDSITYYTPRMHPYTGTFSVSSEPPGADVFLNNIKAGVTSLEIENLQSGDYYLSLLHKNFIPVNEYITIPRLDKLDMRAFLIPCVILRFEPELPAEAIVEIYNEKGVLVAEWKGGDIIKAPAGYSRIVIRGESFHTVELEIQTQDKEVTVPFQLEYYKTKLIFSNLLAESSVFLDNKDVTEKIEGNTLSTVPGSYIVTVVTDKYLTFTSNVVLSGSKEVTLNIPNILDPEVIEKNKRTLVLSTTIPGAVLTAGSLVLNINPVAVNITNSYEGYRALKYTTITTAGLGIALVSVGIIVELLR